MLKSCEAEDPGQHLDQIGVAIKKVSEHQNHVGVLYRYGDTVRMSHLWWHHRLSDEVLDEGYHWGKCGLFEDDPLNGQAFAAKLRAIRQNRGTIPYGFYSKGDAFDEAGVFQPFEEPGMGLTCATYVTSVFEWFGHSIVDLDTWRPRDTDVEWQKGMLSDIETHVSKERADEVAKFVGHIRIRPEEAAAAVIHEPPPISYDVAVRMASEILEVISASEQ
ncbi:hypothetical protein N2601_31075 (plasmid) [Rhizobium sp. CB3060]|uniref:hypothetical protein n=1 Tax=Rhizobium sp. CB3060 TaxID=3138255 RepID=UPI0021A42DCA|nr:hypothetical protein [Rhizobium tropici]UWU25433.1 hypothetical protein N2601_31075 [Rhizobium tropici]